MACPGDLIIDDRETVSARSTLQNLLSELDVGVVGIASLAEWKGTKLEEAALRLLPEVC